METRQKKAGAEAGSDDAAAGSKVLAGGESAAKAAQIYPIVAGTVNQWFINHVHNSPASRDEKVYNHLCKACEELQKALKEALSNV